jgi:hypothetical protein
VLTFAAAVATPVGAASLDDVPERSAKGRSKYGRRMSQALNGMTIAGTRRNRENLVVCMVSYWDRNNGVVMHVLRAERHMIFPPRANLNLRKYHKNPDRKPRYAITIAMRHLIALLVLSLTLISVGTRAMSV